MSRLSRLMVGVVALSCVAFGCAGYEATVVMARAVDAHQRGALATAARAYRDALTLEPHTRGALQNLSLLAHHAGRSDDALAFAQRAVAQFPEEPAPRWNLATLLARRGATEQVTAVLAPLVDAGGVRRVITAESARYAGDHRLARAWLTGESEPHPDGDTAADVQRGLAWLSAAAGEWDESLASLAKIAGELPVPDRLLAAFVRSRHEGPRAALAMLEGLPSPRAAFMRAWCLAAMGSDADARAMLDGVDVGALPSPLRLEAHHLSARLALGAGDHDAARSSLESALALKSGDQTDLELDLVLVLSASGDEDEARERLSSVLERSPEHPRATRLRQLLAAP